MAKVISLFLLPIYTRLFSPEVFGYIEMLNILIAFLFTLMIVGTDSAQSFYFFQQAENGGVAQRNLITSVFHWRIIWGMVCVVLASLFFHPVNLFFFDGDLSLNLFIVICVLTFFQQLQQQSIEVSRLLFRPFAYFVLNISYILLASCVSIILIVFFQYGIEGYFSGFLFASILVTFSGWFLIKGYLDWKSFHWHWWPKILRFGIPLVPNAFAMYVLNTSDRWFISNYRSAEELGLYAVGAKFAMTITLIVQTFRLAWAPIAMQSMQNDSEKDLFRVVSRLYMGLAVSGVVLLTAFSPVIISLMTPVEYFYAYPVVGVLAWYPVFYGFYLIISSGVWKMEKTSWTPILIGGAAVLNILLNGFWVPEYGALGAAAATSVSFLVWNVSVMFLSEKLWFVGYPYGLIAGQIVTGLVACIAILRVYNKGFDYFRTGGIAIFAVIFLGILSISKDELTKLAGKCFEYRR